MQAAQQQTAGERLAELRAELVTVKAARAQFAEWATECQDTSYEQTSEQARHAWASQSNRYRSQEFRQAARILEITTEIAELELQSAPVQVAPIKFEAGQVEGMDETMSFGGVAA